MNSQLEPVGQRALEVDYLPRYNSHGHTMNLRDVYLASLTSKRARSKKLREEEIEVANVGLEFLSRTSNMQDNDSQAQAYKQLEHWILITPTNKQLLMYTCGI